MLEIALSPCPNDTYLFHAWIEGLVGKEMTLSPTFADIQQLNIWGEAKKFPLIKVSISCFAKMQKEYELLPVGCALGWNCGPKLVAREKMSLDQLSHLRVAIPGQETTAHHLLNLLCPKPQEKLFCLYHEIEELLREGVVDAGVIIHETRFTHGFHEIADLGELWMERYDLPLPLGGIAVLKTQPIDLITKIVRDSLAYARSHPEAGEAFILKHAQDKNRDVVQRHIDLYVNEETENLSERGREAIALLLSSCVKI